MAIYIEPADTWLLRIIYLFLLGVGVRAIYRLYFHPLSKFPGPRLAAATGWYQFYYDVILGGQYIFHVLGRGKVDDSKIIRLSPNHLHIDDPDFFQEVFKPGTEFQRDPGFYQSLPLANSLAALADFKEHGIRRKRLNPIFTPSAVAEGLPTLARNLEEIGEILSRSLQDGKPVDVQAHFFYMTINMISDKIFGSSLRILDEKDALDDIATTLEFFHTQSLLFVNFRGLGNLVDRLPVWIIKRIVPGYARLRGYCASKLKTVSDRRREKKEEKKKQKSQLASDRKTLSDVLLDSTPEQERMTPPNIKYLIDESVLFMFVGTDTTAYALSFAVYLLLTHPPVLRKLQAELKGAEAEIRAHDWSHVRKLVYLSAVIEEVLRVSCPVPGQLPRLVPPQGCFVGSQFIPGGTVISLGLSAISTSEAVFGDPSIFRPERWLEDDGRNLDRWRVQFSLGPYSCIGMKLSQMEMAMSLAYIFSRFELALHDTDADTVRVSDYLLAKTKSHVRVKATRDNWH